MQGSFGGATIIVKAPGQDRVTKLDTSQQQARAPVRYHLYYLHTLDWIKSSCFRNLAHPVDKMLVDSYYVLAMHKSIDVDRDHFSTDSCSPLLHTIAGHLVEVTPYASFSDMLNYARLDHPEPSLKCRISL
jgi:hypothetical protein